MTRSCLRLMLLVVLCCGATLSAAEPKILWAHRSTDHFIAAPVLGDQQLFVSALGKFNTAAFYALSLDPAAKERVQWSKTPPALKLPIVSPPAFVGDKIIFGDGMHQNDGANLHCLNAKTGETVWRLAVPGTLVHLEGMPLVVKDRVYMGGGNAGVFCVDLNRVLLDGKEQDAKAVAKELESKWKELVAQYEAEKKKDPDFAIPPDREKLPVPTPKTVWKQEANRWHVDTMLAGAGDKVFAASAYLDEEKQGERSLLCLNADDGQVAWKVSLKFNPWSGPVTAGKTLLVAGSSIRFDPATLPGAQGEIVAVNIENGDVRWRKGVPGGILSSGAVKNETVVYSATDGKVRCYHAGSGQELWTFDASAPLFAGPTIGGGDGETVYVADLKGVVRAIALSDGKEKWKLDLRTNEGAKIGGMVYGTPVWCDGCLYVATCNLVDDNQEGRPNGVVCIRD